MNADVMECRSCGTEVIWARTISGKKMPIDARPIESGNIALEETRDGLVAHVYSLSQIRQMKVDQYVSHFATCRDAAAHRRPR